MKAIEKTGLWLFIGAFFIFLITLTLGEYELTDDVLKNHIENKEHLTQVIEQSDDMLGKTYNNQFAFISDLNEVFNATEQFFLDKNTVSEADVLGLIDGFEKDGKYSVELIKRTIGDEFKEKQQKVVDNTSWMADKDYPDAASFKTDLESKVIEINDQLKNGGNSFANNKNLRFSVTKYATIGFLKTDAWVLALLTFVLAVIGALMHILPRFKTESAGIKNDGIFHHAATNRGWISVAIGTFMITFYIFLYWFPEYLTNWTLMADPLSRLMSGSDASHYFVYSIVYTLAVLVMGVRMLAKYRDNKYQKFRTLSVMFFQTCIAFIIPEIMVGMDMPYTDFKMMWPLDYDFFFNGSGVVEYVQGGGLKIKHGYLGLFLFLWGIVLFMIAVPILTYIYGKRWYCSWVCGCGGLAETLGDPYRQHSDKSLKAWKIERWMILSVLIFVTVMTVVSVYTMFTGQWEIFGIPTAGIQDVYSFSIGLIFAGVVGTGFYPLMGNRVWCRFGCPLAGYIGLVQKFKSRFRITTNGGQCISCGNCSTYCEMGIDVRAYAQKGQDIVRSSCVGCGVCSAVCPRGVLKLENAPDVDRTGAALFVLGNDGKYTLNEKAS